MKTLIASATLLSIPAAFFLTPLSLPAAIAAYTAVGLGWLLASDYAPRRQAGASLLGDAPRGTPALPALLPFPGGACLAGRDLPRAA